MKMKLITSFLLLLTTTATLTNPFDVVEDLKDIEDYNVPIMVDFENFNYRSVERSLFFESLDTLNENLKEYYFTHLKTILNDKTISRETIGVKLTELMGVDFETFLLDVKELEIKLKAFVESDLDMFFVSECNAKYFHARKNFDKCGELHSKLRVSLIFENFFEKGWENMVMDILSDIGVEEEFEEVLMRKLKELLFLFKLPLIYIE